MRGERILIAVIMAAHFGLCLLVLRLFMLVSTVFLARLYMWLVFPLNLLPDTATAYLWPGYYYWTSPILLIALDSVVWGVALGVPLHAIWRRSRKPVA